MKGSGRKCDYYNMKQKYKSNLENTFICKIHGKIKKPFYAEEIPYCPICIIKNLKPLESKLSIKKEIEK